MGQIGSLAWSISELLSVALLVAFCCVIGAYAVVGFCTGKVYRMGEVWFYAFSWFVVFTLYYLWRWREVLAAGDLSRLWILRLDDHHFGSMIFCMAFWVLVLIFHSLRTLSYKEGCYFLGVSLGRLKEVLREVAMDYESEMLSLESADELDCPGSVEELGRLRMRLGTWMAAFGFGHFWLLRGGNRDIFRKISDEALVRLNDDPRRLARRIYYLVLVAFVARILVNPA